MTDQPDNQQKYENYRAQSRRQTSALRSGFYLEAVFIEDRLGSALTHAGAFNPKKQGTITSKLAKLEKLCENRRGLARRYFPAELLAAIRAWKDRRNPLVHELMKQHATTGDFEAVARGRGAGQDAQEQGGQLQPCR